LLALDGPAARQPDRDRAAARRLLKRAIPLCWAPTPDHEDGTQRQKYAARAPDESSVPPPAAAEGSGDLLMVKAKRLSERGGPEVLQWHEAEVGAVGATDALVRHTAIGVNVADVYLRTSLYPQPLPSGIGFEAAGVVEAVGRNVRGIKAGDRVVCNFPLPAASA
jgi:hypothetical protein